MRRLLAIALLLLPCVAHAQGPTVFAAASLTDALKDVAAAWQKQGHPAPRLFVRCQLDAGAADRAGRARRSVRFGRREVDGLSGEAQSVVPDTRRDLLSNKLVLIVPANHPRHVTIGPNFDLAALLGADGRLATGDPAHVPVGIYAEAGAAEAWCVERR